MFIPNLGNYLNVLDWMYIFAAVLIVEFAVITMAKYPGPRPFFKVEALDKWYTKFGILGVSADIISIMIGIGAARYIYTALADPNVWNPLLFFAVLVGFQLLHDLFFFFGVIDTMQKGKNEMIDVFKEYAEENGAKILVADALMMISSAATAMLLKTFPLHYTISASLVTMYSICFIVFTKNPFIIAV